MACEVGLPAVSVGSLWFVSFSLQPVQQGKKYKTVLLQVLLKNIIEYLVSTDLVKTRFPPLREHGQVAFRVKIFFS